MTEPRGLRIAVDARCLNQVHVRGMGKYLDNLMVALSRRSPHTWHLCADRPDLPFHMPGVPNASAHVFDCRGYRFHAWEQGAFPRAARRLRADVIHAPATTVPWWQPAPTVVNIHDTITWGDSSDAWPPGWYRDTVLPSAYAKCARIITSSESSRRDIEQRWPRLAEKIVVIPHGIDARYLGWRPAPLTDALRSLGVRPPYLLYLGGDIARKRPGWAISVFAASAGPDALLVMCGVTPAGQATLLERADPAVRGRVVFMPFVGEDDMASLYGNAAAVLYPTLYEGFGFPMIEAQAVGTPVVFSPLGSLAELQGPAAVALPPDDFDAWRAACRRLVEDRRAGHPQHEASRAWSAGFSWARAAEQTERVYLQAASPDAPATAPAAS